MIGTAGSDDGGEADAVAQDARVRYTRMVIRTSFVRLLERKPLSKITVKEICEAAQINRATFYRHYLDVYDLMEQVEAESLRELQQTLQADAQQGLRRMLTSMLEKIRQSGTLYATLFSEHGDPGFPLKVFKACYPEAAADMLARYPGLDEARRTWVYVYAAQGSSGILSCWIAGGMAEPPEQVAGMMEALIAHSLQCLE